LLNMRLPWVPEHSFGASVSDRSSTLVSTYLPHVGSVSRNAPSYRGFSFESYQPAGEASRKRALRATRGCITLFVEVEAGQLPTQWRLRDILEYEINRLLEPTTLRHVDHLN